MRATAQGGPPSPEGRGLRSQLVGVLGEGRRGARGVQASGAGRPAGGADVAVLLVELQAVEAAHALVPADDAVKGSPRGLAPHEDLTFCFPSGPSG